MNTDYKLEVLKGRIAEKGSMLVAYSGGVDSGLLAALARDMLGKNTHCILIDSPVVPRRAVEEAQIIARELGLSFEIIRVPVLDDERFRGNPPDRCYHCKKNDAHILKERARELGFACVADGMNRSDIAEHRPGLLASTEEGIVHPFIEADISKSDIRRIARGRGTSFWDKPSAACLSSRIPYGEEITMRKLRMIEAAEDFLQAQGFRQVRVRYHAEIARIEVSREDLPRLFAMRETVVSQLKESGFSYVTLDMEGYRSGSMDEVL